MSCSKFWVTNVWASNILRTLYYVLIILGLIWLYGQGNFSSPQAIYQGF
ncbi:MAG: teichoic acid D-Ala incorporation-associated protein DltX [Chloroflexi bacterium]|nr:teichoic acid D-Ala incorporation-associated protein DltX [Chloroflexota bacterium]